MQFMTDLNTWNFIKFQRKYKNHEKLLPRTISYRIPSRRGFKPKTVFP